MDPALPKSADRFPHSGRPSNPTTGRRRSLLHCEDEVHFGGL